LIRPLLFLAITAHFAMADSVDNYVVRQMKENRIPGGVRVILRNARIIKQQEYGLANIELGLSERLLSPVRLIRTSGFTLGSGVRRTNDF
jgi:hypothetical protein